MIGPKSCRFAEKYFDKFSIACVKALLLYLTDRNLVFLSKLFDF